MKYMKISIGLLITIISLAVSMTAFGFLGFGGSEKWKEEVQLSDGRVIVVEREMLREGGGDEWSFNRSGTKPKEYRIGFANPDGSGNWIEWRSTKKDAHFWPEIPLVLDVESGQPIVFTSVFTEGGGQVYVKYLFRNGAWTEEHLPEMFEQHTSNLLIFNSKNTPKFVELATKRKENLAKPGTADFLQVGPNRKVNAK